MSFKVQVKHANTFVARRKQFTRFTFCASGYGVARPGTLVMPSTSLHYSLRPTFHTLSKVNIEKKVAQYQEFRYPPTTRHPLSPRVRVD